MTHQQPFIKMHGLGNDFMVVNAINHPFEINAKLIRELANRHTGIGFDQLLIIKKSQQADFACSIFNSDGTEAEQCGNGLRCVARYIHEHGLSPATIFTIATKAGVHPVQIQDYQHIKVTLGTPTIVESLIELPINKTPTSLSILDLGNPHAILRIDSLKIDSLDHPTINELAADISTHGYFKQGVNVGFMQIINPTHIRLRTFERGAGETFACGSNACAAALAGIVNGWLSSPVTVEFRYGKLMIDWDKDKNLLHMIGPAEMVFEGKV